MKNYLFRPFQNDNEKEDVFKEYQDNHKHLDNSQVIGFICRLESTYDVIISKLQADNVELHQEAEEIAEGNNEYFDQVMELKADNKRLNDKDGLYDEVKELQAEYDELQAENKRLQDELQAVNDDYNNDHKVHDEYADGLLEEIKELKNKLSNYNCGCKYPKELKADAEEYFDNNPHEEKVFYFVVGASGCEEDGDVKGSLNCECDAVAEFDNYDGIVSGEVYK